MDCTCGHCTCDACGRYTECIYNQHACPESRHSIIPDANDEMLHCGHTPGAGCFWTVCGGPHGEGDIRPSSYHVEILRDMDLLSVRYDERLLPRPSCVVYVQQEVGEYYASSTEVTPIKVTFELFQELQKNTPNHVLLEYDIPKYDYVIVKPTHPKTYDNMAEFIYYVLSLLKVGV